MCLVVCRDRLLPDAAVAAGLEPCAERPVPDFGRAGLPPRAADLGAWRSCPGHPDGLGDELGGAPRPLHRHHQADPAPPARGLDPDTVLGRRTGGVMFSIGDFARHGRVSVRMPRHYAGRGLLPPARVDRVTGYRWYEAAQLSRLNRIVALKDLGFTLEQVRSVLDDKVSAGELRGMLRLRRAELQSQIATDTTRLTEVEARLQIIEREGAMPADDVQIKRIPAIRVAQR